jgi:hypothetical protein
VSALCKITRHRQAGPPAPAAPCPRSYVPPSGRSAGLRLLVDCIHEPPGSTSKGERLEQSDQASHGAQAQALLYDQGCGVCASFSKEQALSGTVATNTPLRASTYVAPARFTETSCHTGPSAQTTFSVAVGSGRLRTPTAATNTTTLWLIPADQRLRRVSRHEPWAQLLQCASACPGACREPTDLLRHFLGGDVALLQLSGDESRIETVG